MAVILASQSDSGCICRTTLVRQIAVTLGALQDHMLALRVREDNHAALVDSFELC